MAPFSCLAYPAPMDTLDRIKRGLRPAQALAALSVAALARVWYWQMLREAITGDEHSQPVQNERHDNVMPYVLRPQFRHSSSEAEQNVQPRMRNDI